MEESRDATIKRELHEYANNLGKQMKEIGPGGLSYFERRKILRAVKETLDWLKSNPHENWTTYQYKYLQLQNSTNTQSPKTPNLCLDVDATLARRLQADYERESPGTMSSYITADEQLARLLQEQEQPLQPTLTLTDEELAFRLQQDFLREERSQHSQHQQFFPHDHQHQQQFLPHDHHVQSMHHHFPQRVDAIQHELIEVGENLSYEELLQLEEKIGKVNVISQDDLLQLPIFVWDGENLSDKMCGICLSSWEKSDLLRRLTCLHSFHKECIDTWLSQNSTCPICKNDVRPSK